MATWTTIPNADIAQDKPIKAETGLALRDNVTAAMEGASGAPPLLEAAIGAWYYTSDGIGTFAFARADTTDKAFGDTISGSNLYPTSALWKAQESGGTFLDGAFPASGIDGVSNLSGTWQCLGTYSYREDFDDSANTFYGYGATLWQRIA